MICTLRFVTVARPTPASTLCGTSGSYRTTRPRTIASAVASVATRNPRRPSSAWRTASLTSAVSRGSGVSLSNGRMATVLTLGRVPPANPYRQPVSHRQAALATTAPESRRKDLRRIERHHSKLKSGSPRYLWEVDARARGMRQCVESRPAARYHFPPPPPFGFEHPHPETRAVGMGHDVIERILRLREPPHDATRVTQRIHELRTKHGGIVPE